MNIGKFKLLFLALGTPLLWSGCSRGLPLEEDDFPLTERDELTEIRLQSVASPLEGSTRAPFIGGIKEGNSLVAKVLLSGVSGKYLEGETSGYHNGSMTFDGLTSTKGFNTRQYYPADGSDIYLYGLYPAEDRWTNYTGEVTTVDFTFDGKTDVMAAAQVATNKAEAKAGTYKELKFRHLLTNLIVLAQVGTEGGVVAKDIQDAWGRITGIELTKALGVAPNDKVTVGLSSTEATPVAPVYSTSGAYGVKFYNASGTGYPVDGVSDPFSFKDTPLSASEGSATVIPETAKAVAYSLIAPVNATGGTNDFELLVKTERNTGGIPVNISLSKAGNTAGQYCMVTLTFKNTTIQATASVEDWKEGSTSGGTLQ